MECEPVGKAPRVWRRDRGSGGGDRDRRGEEDGVAAGGVDGQPPDHLVRRGEARAPRVAAPTGGSTGSLGTDGGRGGGPSPLSKPVRFGVAAKPVATPTPNAEVANHSPAESYGGVTSLGGIQLRLEARRSVDRPRWLGPPPHSGSPGGWAEARVEDLGGLGGQAEDHPPSGDRREEDRPRGLEPLPQEERPAGGRGSRRGRGG